MENNDGNFEDERPAFTLIVGGKRIMTAAHDATHEAVHAKIGEALQSHHTDELIARSTLNE